MSESGALQEKNPVGRTSVYSMTDKWYVWIEEWKTSTIDTYTDGKLNKVNLPTIESLALFLHNKIVKDKNVKAHSISLSTIESYIFIREDRDNTQEEFVSVAKWIKAEQKKRLFENGLSNDYNASIAKLILSSIHGIHEKTVNDQNVKFNKMPDIIIDGEEANFNVGQKIKKT